MIRSKNCLLIVAGILQADRLAPYQCINCLHYVRSMSIDLIKGDDFTLKRTRSRLYPAETMTIGLALVNNTPAQAKS